MVIKFTVVISFGSSEDYFYPEFPSEADIGTLYYSSEVGGKRVRNTRDSSYYPGNTRAGLKGITKEMLNFIYQVVSTTKPTQKQNVRACSTLQVNPLAYEVAAQGKDDHDDFIKDDVETEIENVHQIHEDFFTEFNYFDAFR